MLKIGNIKIENPYFLAPMAGVTDKPFRTICKEMGAGFLYSEFVSSEGIVRNNDKTLQYMNFNKFERPIGIQIFGNDPEVMSRSAKIIEKNIKPDLIDLNFGCPVKKVVKKGAGAALMKNIKLMVEITEKIVDTVNIPVTAKIRSGWNDENINAVDVAMKLEKVGVKAITIHPRTAKMKYSGKADWSIIQKIKENVKIPVIGNGDVMNSKDAVRMFNETNCDGIMIGRGALGNPWIFRELNKYISIKDKNYKLINVNLIRPSYQEIFSIMKKHLNLIEDHYPEKIAYNMFKSHFAWYTKGMKNATKYRDKINHAKSIDEMKTIINFYKSYLN
ncbi:MAG: tRNA dihydrouridine synthase DusB [Candidatus Marinimicrobia bacterium]|nr:tRNA dihydrouridine synthase DusB [Candidatus Neomarinimicrobiota bacterium]